MFRAAWVLYVIGLAFSALHTIGDAGVWYRRFPDVPPRLFAGLMLFVLAIFSNIPFLLSFRALRTVEVHRSWKILIVGSLIVNAALLLFIPGYAREIGYPFWLLAFAALAWAFLFSTDDRTPSVTKNRFGRVVAADGQERVPFLVWVWLAFTLFWIGVTTSTYVHRNDRPSSTAALAGYVTDPGHLLADNVRAGLLGTLDAFEKETSTQIAVAIYPSAPAGPIEDFTIHIAESSRLGTAAHDNGAILFVFARERVARMEVGYGLEGALPDAIVHRILATRLAPALAAGNYARGLMDAVTTTADTVRSEYHGRVSSGLASTALERIKIAWRRVRTEGWKFLDDAPIEGRVVLTFFGGFFALLFREGLRNAARLAGSIARRIVNVVRRRPIAEGVGDVEYLPVIDTIKVLVFFVAILQGIVLVAGGGAFGGAGAAVRW